MREQKDFYGWMTGRIASFKPKLVAHGYFRNKHKSDAQQSRGDGCSDEEDGAGGAATDGGGRFWGGGGERDWKEKEKLK